MNSVSGHSVGLGPRRALLEQTPWWQRARAMGKRSRERSRTHGPQGYTGRTHGQLPPEGRAGLGGLCWAQSSDPPCVVRRTWARVLDTEPWLSRQDGGHTSAVAAWDQAGSEKATVSDARS